MYDALLGNFTHKGALAPGAEYRVSGEVRLPDNFSGDFRLIAYADAPFTPADGVPLPYPVMQGPARLRGGGDGMVKEYRDEANNAANVALKVTPVTPPDLQVTAVSGPERVFTGRQFTVTYSVANRGAGVVPDRQGTWFDYVYLSRDTFLDARGDHYIAEVKHEGVLQPNGTYTVTQTWNVPRGLVGAYYVIVLADRPDSQRPRGYVFESDRENNNSAASSVPMLIELPPPSDLQVEDIIVPSTARAGDEVSVSWRVTNKGVEPASGRWADAAFLSRDAVWDLGDRLITNQDFSPRTLAPGQSYTFTTTVRLPVALPENYRVIVRTDIFDDIFEGENNRNNTTASADTIAVTVPTLELGVATNDLLSDGEELLYRVEVAAGETLRIDLDSANDGLSNELYVRFEGLPSSRDFDAAYPGGLQGDQTATVGRTQGGVYYIRVRHFRNPAPVNEAPRFKDVAVTLKATLIPFGITDVTPDTGGDSRYVTMTVHGAKFDPQATLKLIRPEFAEFAPVSYQVIDATRIIGTFDLRDAPRGLYDVQVTNPDGTVAIVPYRFLVEAAQPLNVTVGLGGPSDIPVSKTGTTPAFYQVGLLSLTNIDTPYAHLSFGVPRLPENPLLRGQPIGKDDTGKDIFSTGERLRFTTNLAGEPALAGVDWPGLNPVINDDGILIAEGFAFDLHNQGFAAVSFLAEVYPELNAILKENPRFLDQLADFELEDLAFEFYIFATVTPMTAGEYVAYQTEQAAALRTAILADDLAPQALRVAAADAQNFTNLYLTSLADTGQLRAEDLPPAVREAPQFTGLVVTMAAGLLGSESGAPLLAEGDLTAFFKLLRKWAGDQPDAYGSAAIPDAARFDLGFDQETRFEAFIIQVGVSDLVEGEQDAAGVAQDSPLNNLFGLTGERSRLVKLTGPGGFGDANLIPLGLDLPYTVRFEHLADAPDAINEIRIIQQLDPKLDPRRFRLSDIQLGDLLLDLPNRASFTGEFDYVADRGYVVQVTAGVDVESRLATWLIRAIDPDTGLTLRGRNLQTGQPQGLLLPGASGVIGYTIEASDAAATGDVVRSTARVIYNADAPLDSNTHEATLDTVAPKTVVNVRQAGSTYTLDWSSTDDTLGSGVKEYTVYVSLDGGPFVVFLSRTTGTSLTFPSPDNLPASFLVRAQDQAGNVEAAPDGVFIAPIFPSVNLGTLPQAPQFAAPELPRASVADKPSTNPLFTQALLRIPGRQSATRASDFDVVFEPFTASGFATNIPPSDAGIGPLGIAFAPDGQTVFISGGPGRNQLWTFNLAGGAALTPLTTLDVPIYDMAFDMNGLLWATTGGGPLVQLDPETGQILQRYGEGVNLGLAVDTARNRLFVSTRNGVEFFDIAAAKFSPFSNTRVDGLALAPDGTLWAAAWPKGGQVVRFDQRGRAEIALVLEREAEGLAFGAPGTPTANLLFITHSDGGALTVVDLVSMKHTEIASGGSRGDFIHVNKDGRVFVTQSDQVSVLFPVVAPQVITTTPLPKAAVTPIVNRASLTFNIDMLASTTSDAASVLNLSNYSLKNVNTGQPVQVGRASYDPARRTVDLSFESLSPDQYELRVAKAVQSDLGVTLTDDFTTQFFVLTEVTDQLVPQFNDTRLNRAEGTVSFEVRVNNSLSFAVAAPIRLIFAGLVDESIELLGLDGRTAEGHPYLDLNESAAQILAAGQSLTTTVTVRDPDMLRLDLKPRVLAGLPTNLRPLFSTTPVNAGKVGTAYNYAAQATDPDGAGVFYTLVRGPSGATLNVQTGQLAWTPAAPDGKEVSFELRAYDNRGGYAAQNWKVALEGGNTAPVLFPLENKTVKEGELLELRPGAFDADGDRLLFGVNNLPPGAFFDPQEQVLRWRPDGEGAGRYSSIEMFVTDDVQRVSGQFEILVTNVNQAPTLDPVIDRTIREGETLTFALSARDVDGDAITFEAPLLPPGAFLDPNTGVFTWTPRYDQHSEYAVEMFASDGAARVSRTMKLTVLNVNAPVDFARLDKLVFYEGQSFALRVAADDPDHPSPVGNALAVGPDLEVELGATLSVLSYTNTALPAGMTYDPKLQVLAWMPGATQAGSYSITFTATDDGDGTGQSLSDTVTVEIEVLDANLTPMIDTIVGQTVKAGQTLEIPVRATDPDGTVPLLKVEGLPSYATFANNGNGTGKITATPGLTDRGGFTVVVRATDDGNGDPSKVQIGELAFVLSVDLPNAQPQMDYLGDKAALIGKEIVFQVRVRDLDEDALTFSATGLPQGATFANTAVYGMAEFRWTPAAANAGTIPITFRVADSGNGTAANVLSDSRTINLIVRAANAAPVATAVGERTIAEGQTLVLDLVATDPDNDKLTWTSASLPRGAALTPDGGRFVWTPDFTQAGTYSISFTASDGAASATTSSTITVTNANTTPRFVTPPGLFAVEGAEFGFSVIAGDLDGDPLAYEYLGALPGGAEFDPLTSVFQWTPGYDAAGTYPLRFKATDPQGASVETTVRLQVLNVNQPPVIAAFSDHVALVGQPFRFTVPGTDADAGTKLLYSITNLPAGAAFNADTGEFVWTPLAVQAGEHNVRFTAFDGELGAARTLRLVVSPQPIPPSVLIDFTPSFPLPGGQSVLIQATASSISAITAITIAINGQPLTLDPFNRARITPAAPGQYIITATAKDADGFTGTTTRELKVRDLADREAPVVQLFVPPVGAILAQATDVTGAVADSNLDFYRLEFAPLGSDSFTTLAQGRVAINGLLTRLDPNQMSNGAYLLRLTAQDMARRATIVTRMIEVNTTTKTAAFQTSATDLTVTLNGVSVPITRYYSSADRQVPGSFGYGWTFGAADPHLTTNVPPSSDTDATGRLNPFTDTTRAYVNLPDGSRAGFTFTPLPITVGGTTLYRPAWRADAGINHQLATGDVLLEKAGDAFYAVGTGLPYNIGTGVAAGDTAYSLTASDGTRYDYAAEGQLRQLTAANSQKFIWSDSGVTAANGERVSFQRDAAGRLTTVLAPDGTQILYGYDDVGNLQSVTNLRNGQRSVYGYAGSESHQLTAVIGPTPASSVSVSYTNGTLTSSDPIQTLLGSTRQFLGVAKNDSLDAGETDRFTFVLSERELKTNADGKVTLGIEVKGQGTFNPAALTLVGATADTSLVQAGRSIALYTVDAAGPYVIEVRGADAQTNGSYAIEVYLAGDVNADGRADGVDSGALDAALGTSTGQPNFSPTADTNRDGKIDVVDQQNFVANFGFTANQAPTATARTFSTARGLSLTIDLASLAADAEGDDLTFLLSNIRSGTLQLLGDGRRVSFTPAVGFSGAAGFDLQADDGSLTSTVVSVTINVSGAAPVELVLSRRDPVLQVGESLQFSATFRYADGSTQSVPNSLLTFRTEDASIVAASASGAVIGVKNGTTALVVAAQGLTAATAISVGEADERQVEFFPLSYALQVGQTRTLIVRDEVTPGVILSRKGAVDGVSYIIGNDAIGSISADGVFTAVSLGFTQITIIYGGHSAVAEFVVTAPVTGTITVNGSGGVVTTSDGIEVGIGPGALPDGSTVTINSRNQADLPMALPDGYTFGGAVGINMNGSVADDPLSLAFNAPAGAQVGQQVFILMAVLGRDGADSTSDEWLLVDSAIVGADGKVRTTSPPQGGFGGSLPNGVIFRPAPEAYLVAAVPTFTNMAFALGMMSSRIGTTANVTGPNGVPMRTITGFFGDFLIPVVPGIDYKLKFITSTPDGYVSSINTNVMLRPGELKSYGVITAPPAPLTRGIKSPEITAGKVTFGDLSRPGAVLELTGTFLFSNPDTNAPSTAGKKKGDRIEDLSVIFQVGGRDGVDNKGNKLIVGGPDFVATGADLELSSDSKTLKVRISNGVTLGLSQIFVVRKMDVISGGKYIEREYTSGPLFMLPDARYGFAALGGADAISVIDTTLKSTDGLPRPDEVAKISIGLAGQRYSPRMIAVSPDGTRAYVTLADGGSIAVIDALALHEVDVDPNTGGLQKIVLPNGARPFGIAIDPLGLRAYVSDEAQGAVYVIDIDPNSSKFNKQIKTIGVGFVTTASSVSYSFTPSPLGLRNLVVAPDGQFLYVAAPGNTIFGKYGAPTGAMLIVDLRDRDLPVQIQSIPVGPEPYGVSTTTDPNVILFTDRKADTQGLGILRRHVVNGTSVWQTSYVSLIDFGIDRPGAGVGLSPVAADQRASQVFGVTNASGVTFLPENAWESIVGPHPAFAFITSYNKFVQDDPKHDPNIGPVIVSHPSVVFPGTTTKRLLFEAAGGNVGIISNVLGSFADPDTKPTLVAATRPIPNSFPDNVVISPDYRTLLLGSQAINSVLAFDVVQILATIKEYNKKDKDLARSSGALNLVPIDDISPLIDVRGDVRFYANTEGTLVMGTPPKDVLGRSPNTFGPITPGRLPRGLGAQPRLNGTLLPIADNPYNQKNGFGVWGGPEDVQETAMGTSGFAEVHAGTFDLTHNLVTYRSLGQTHGLQLVYDSLRADPRPIIHFTIANVPGSGIDRRLIASLTATLGDYRVSADGLSPGDVASELGLFGGENFWLIPTGSGDVSAALQLNLGEGKSGLYQVSLTAGVYDFLNGRFSGRGTTSNDTVVVVNERDGIFGAGWGIGGVQYFVKNDDGSLLLIDGDGSERLFRPPANVGEAFVSPAGDFSIVTQDAGTGIVRRKLTDGTVVTFNGDLRIESSVDRNGNETKYAWAGKRLLSITDEVGQATRFDYSGDRVSAVIDPAGKRTVLSYDGDGNLQSITDPDGATQTFGYDDEHRMTGAGDRNGQSNTIHYNFAGRVDYALTPKQEKMTLESVQMTGLYDPKLTADHKSNTPIGFTPLAKPEAKSTDRNGANTLYQLNQKGQALAVKADGAPLVVRERDADGLITKETSGGVSTTYETDGAGHVTKTVETAGGSVTTVTSRYDGTFGKLTFQRSSTGIETTFVVNSSNGNVTTKTTILTDATTTITSQTYYANGQIRTITQPTGVITTYTYNSRGLLIKEVVTSPIAGSGDRTKTYDYDTSGNLTVFVDGVGRRFEYEYDAMNRRKKITAYAAGKAQVVTVDYNAAGQVETVTNPNGVLNLGHDSDGNPITTDNKPSPDADPNSPTYSPATSSSARHDANGNVISTTDELGRTTNYSYNAAGQVLTKTDPLGGTTSYSYDSEGRLATIKNPLGAVSARTYDAAGRLATVSDPLGGITRYTYDVYGRQIAVTDALGNTTHTAFDDRNQPIRVTDPLGNVTTIEYDSLGRVVAIIDPLGNRTERSYNAFSELAQVKDPMGDITKYEYDSAGRMTKMTDALGRTTRYEYDENDKLTKLIDAAGNATVSTYDNRGLLLSTTDALGNTTSFTYDIRGRLIARTDAIGNVTRSTYDAVGNVLSETDAVGNTLRYTYDKLDRRITRTDPLGNVTKLAYDAVGRLLSMTDPLGKTTTYAYDANGRLVAETDPIGATTRYRYDANGLLIKRIDALGNTTSYDYDANGRRIRNVDALGGIVTFTYDAAGRVVSTTDQLGHVSTFAYDGNNRQTSAKDALGATTTISYDAVGNRTAVVDALGNRTTYTYDVLNRQIAVTDALGGNWTSTFDAAGQLTTTTDAIGEVTRYEYDALGRLVARVDAVGARSTAAFDAAGRLLSETDALGAVTRYEYDANGRRTAMIDALGGRSTTSYDANGRVISTTDPRGSTFTRNYDAVGRIIRTTDALGQDATYAYDVLGRVVSTTLPDGAVTTQTYDALGRIARSVDALGQVRTTTYDAVGNVVSTTDEAGRTTLSTYDADNRLVVVIGELGQTTTFVRDILGRVLVVRDPLGRESRTTYDALGRGIRVTDALGGEISTTYDAVGNMLSITDALGRVTRHEYDARSRVVRVIDPLGGTTDTQYDAEGRVIATTNALGEKTTYTYDVLGRRISATDALGQTSSSTYDARGNVITSRDASGRVTTYTYDAIGRITKTTLPNGDVTTLTYDAGSNVASQVNGMGETTRYSYDLLGRLLSTTRPNGATTSYTYNAVGQVTSVTDANHNVTTSTYDALGRLVRQVDPLGAARTYVYDLANQLTSLVDRDGRTTTFAYDARGLRTSEVWRDGGGQPVETITYSYNAVGELLTLTTNDTVLAYTYDARGLVLSESNAGTVGSTAVIFTLTRDALGRVITRQETINGQPGAKETYAFDAAGRETSITQSGAGVAAISVSWSFDATGRPISETRVAAGATAVSTTRNYDANGRLSGLAYTGSAAALAAYTLEFDAAGRINKLTQSGRTSIYVYDAAGQLVTVQHDDPAIPDEYYTYDAAGNRIDSTSNGASVLGAGNRLLSDATAAYTYDAEGNLLARTDKTTGVKREFTWDHRNRLVSVADRASDGTLVKLVTFAYDGTDRRIRTIEDSAPGSGAPVRGRYFASAGAALILEFVDFDVGGGAAPQLAVRYFHGPQIDQVLAQEVTDTGVQWLLANHEGTISEIATAAGAAAQHFDYDAFGNVVRRSAPDVDSRIRFTGREFDFETGLYYYRARYMDPHTGRFLSEDPSSFSSGDTNLYRYSGNDPVNRVDPSGRTSYVPASVSSAEYQEALRQYGLKPTQQDLTLAVLERIGKQNEAFNELSLGEKISATWDRWVDDAQQDIRDAAQAFDDTRRWLIQEVQQFDYGVFFDGVFSWESVKTIPIAGAKFVGGVAVGVVKIGAELVTTAWDIGQLLLYGATGYFKPRSTMFQAAMAAPDLLEFSGQAALGLLMAPFVAIGAFFSGDPFHAGMELPNFLLTVAIPVRSMFSALTGAKVFPKLAVAAEEAVAAQVEAAVVVARAERAEAAAANAGPKKGLELAAETRAKASQEAFDLLPDEVPPETVPPPVPEPPSVLNPENLAARPNAPLKEPGAPPALPDETPAPPRPSGFQIAWDAEPVSDLTSQPADLGVIKGFITINGKDLPPAQGFKGYTPERPPEWLYRGVKERDFAAVLNGEVVPYGTNKNRSIASITHNVESTGSRSDMLNATNWTTDPTVAEKIFSEGGLVIRTRVSNVIDQIVPEGAETINKWQEARVLVQGTVTDYQIYLSSDRSIAPVGRTFGSFDPRPPPRLQAADESSGIVDQQNGQSTSTDLSPTSVGASPSAPSRLESDSAGIVQVATGLWEQVIGQPVNLKLSLIAADLPKGQLGYAVITAIGADGLPAEGQLVYDRDADGHGWFEDATPGDNTEFVASASGALAAMSGTAAVGRYDLLTLVMHEVGHLLGFTQGFSGFASLIEERSDGSAWASGPSIEALLTPDRDHLSPHQFTFDLMTPTLGVGVRRLPSAMDGLILNAAWEAAEAAELAQPGRRSFQVAAGKIAFTLLADAVAADAVAPHPGIANGNFAVGDAQTAGFGWRVFDAGAVASGRAVLNEGQLLFTDFSQTFAIPEGATALRFTLSSVVLGAGALNPPDAFEAALLNALTGQPLAGIASGLAGTDALLNVQADRKTYFSPKVNVQGVTASGGTLAGQDSWTVTIDLRGTDAGTVATFYLDLIGFGDKSSTVTIDDVQLISGPPLDFNLDVASDSGIVGDNLTNIERVTLIGTTVPRQTVVLDVDGDGFDDGTVTADDAGEFKLASLTLKDGENAIRLQTTGPDGSTISERTITLDRVAPRVVAYVINNNEIQRSKVTSLRFQFSENVLESFTAADLELRNLTSQSSVAPTAMQFTYGIDHSVVVTFPTLAGRSLPDGNYLATLKGAGITDAAGNALDTAGNGNPGGDFNFSFFRYFGDIDGDRDVDFLDWYHFQSSNQRKLDEPGYNAGFDYDGDGDVDEEDLKPFRDHYFTVLAAPPARSVPAAAVSQPGDSGISGKRIETRGAVIATRQGVLRQRL